MNNKRLTSISNHDQPKQDIPTHPHPKNYHSSSSKTHFQSSARRTPVVNLVRPENRHDPKKPSRLKPMLLASGSAVMIGMILGFFMLNMFTQFGNSSQQQGSHIDAIGLVENQEDTDEDGLQINEVQTVSTTIEAFRGFVLQAGVFSTKENAELGAASYHEHGFSTLIWERDQQFFLFSGIAQSQEQAKGLVSDYEAYGLEVFVKEWTTPDITIQLTSEEKDWLDTLIGLWQNVNPTAPTNTQEWKQLLADFPTSAKLDPIKTVLNDYVSHQDQLNPSKSQQLKLAIWQSLEGLAQTE